MLSQNNNYSGFYFDDNPSDEFVPFNGKTRTPILSSPKYKYNNNGNKNNNNYIHSNNKENEGTVYLSEPFVTYYLDKLNLDEESSKKDFIMHGPKMPIDYKTLSTSPQLIEKDRDSGLFFNSKDNDDSDSVISLANTSEMSISDFGSINSSSNSELSFDTDKQNERELQTEDNLKLGEKMAFDFKNWFDSIDNDNIDNFTDLSINKKNIVSGVYLDNDPSDSFNSKNLFALTLNDKSSVEKILPHDKKVSPTSPTTKKSDSTEFEIISGIYMENGTNEISKSLDKDQSKIDLSESKNIFALTIKEKSQISINRNKDLGVVYNNESKILAILPFQNYNKLNKIIDTSEILYHNKKAKEEMKPTNNIKSNREKSILEIKDSKKIIDYLKSSVDKIFQHKINDNNPENEIDKMIEMAAIMVKSAVTPNQKNRLMSEIIESIN